MVDVLHRVSVAPLCRELWRRDTELDAALQQVQAELDRAERDLSATMGQVATRPEMAVNLLTCGGGGLRAVDAVGPGVRATHGR